MGAIQHRRSSTAGAVPASLEPGEIAINETDRKLFYRGPGGAVASHDLAAGAGAWELIGTPTVVSSAVAAVEFAGAWSYKALRLTATGVSTSAAAWVRAQISDDGGATWEACVGHEAHQRSITWVSGITYDPTTNYAYAHATTTAVVMETLALASSAIPVLGTLTAASVNGTFTLEIGRANEVGGVKPVAARGAGQTAGVHQITTCQSPAMGAVDRIRITASSGNIDGGTFVLEGMT